MSALQSAYNSYQGVNYDELERIVAHKREGSVK